MPRANDEVAAAFAELADLTELTGGDRFRILASRRTSEMISSLATDLKKMSEKELMTLRGIGKGTAARILEFIEKGTMEVLEELRLLVPAGVRAMTALPGVGPKKAMLLHSALGVSTLDELYTALREGRVREVKGMGAKSEESLLRSLERRRREPEERRILLESALTTAEEMIRGLTKAGVATRIDYAGSLRRMRDTIGDIDLLAAGEDAESIMDAFTSLPTVVRVAARGTTKSTVVTHRGLQVDLRVVAPDEWGAALQYFTGSKDHNVKVRENAVKQGYKLSEYGLFQVKGGARVAAETEEEVYSALGMQTPLPTMREDKGEVELALKAGLPRVVELGDIRGELHSHSTYSDGFASVEEMARAAADHGYEYYAITDHGEGRWPPMRDIDRQANEVQALNQAYSGKMTILHGVEMSIASDGSLGMDPETLARFGLVIASIHNAMGQESETMTRRIIAAIEHPRVNVLGHPTGRRINKRAPIEFDLEAVFEAAAANSVALEISGHPERLDLRDEHARLARRFGCKFVINTDSHRSEGMSRMRLGVATAQRAWVEPEEVINTWPMQRLRQFLDKGA